MCGITGLVGAVDRAVLERMTAALRHRGPDADGIAVGDGWGFGHRRLSIIDLSGGAQPMSTADGRLWVTYNGEIYNFEALRDELAAAGHDLATRSDTEVLLYGYREWGDDVVEHLRGMFAFAIWDEGRRRLFMARDRIGIKPLYWGQAGGTFAFASEPKALLEHPGLSREIDLQAFDAYLDLLYVPPPLSMFRGIRQLPPGHRLIWEDGEVETSRWWDAVPDPRHDRSADEWAESLAPLLEDAIASHTIADVPVGAFLSGGVDSSTIVAILAERGHEPVRTFCVGYGPEGQQWDERAAARRIARHFGTEHHEIELSIDVLGELERTVRGFDEPYGNSTALMQSALSKYTRQFVTVALAGDGGDELFGGYPRYRGMQLAQWLQVVPAGIMRAAKRVLERVGESPRPRAYGRWARQFLDAADKSAPQRYASFVTHCRRPERDRWLSARVRDALPDADRMDPVAAWFSAAPTGDGVERAAYADLHGFLPDNVLRGSDRMSMAHSLELRVPLCDHHLVEATMQIPSRHRIGALTSKRILRRIMRDRLPPEVLRGRKLGFNAPIALWLRRDLDRLVSQWLGRERILQRGLLDPNAVAQCVAEHRSGRRDFSTRLWSLIVVEQWCQLYLD